MHWHTYAVHIYVMLGYRHRSSGRVKQQSLEEEWFDEHSTWDAEMKPSVLDQASTHHAQVPVIAEDDVSHDSAFCLVTLFICITCFLSSTCSLRLA